MRPNNNRFFSAKGGPASDGKSFLKTISLALVGSFFLEQLAFAAPDIKPISLDFLAKPKISLDIPESVATVEAQFIAPNTEGVMNRAPTIYLIQDAHTNTSGQLNLAKTLD